MQAPAPGNPPLLTLITNTSFSQQLRSHQLHYSGQAFFDGLHQALAGGVDAVLLREQQLSSARLLALASRLRKITHQFGARLIIHTQADIAAAVDADGVHVSSANIKTIPATRQWLTGMNPPAIDAKPPPPTVSASCHNAAELEQARLAGADYAMLSPVFPTSSHPGAAALGIQTFKSIVSQTALPIVALGGINAHNCVDLAGQPMAVISAILEADDPQAVARQMASMANGARA